MPINASETERLLGINTLPSAYESRDENHSPYEPTDYAVLMRLAKSGIISSDDTVVDYGSGKGRVCFYLNYALSVKTIGVEYNESLHASALANLSFYKLKHPSGRGISFVHACAEDYRVTNETVFFFFNPFSDAILSSVLEEIFGSYYVNPRLIRLIFYYAFDETLSLLFTDDRLSLESEIDVSDLSSGKSPQERILIFRVTL